MRDKSTKIQLEVSQSSRILVVPQMYPGQNWDYTWEHYILHMWYVTSGRNWVRNDTRTFFYTKDKWSCCEENLLLFFHSVAWSTKYFINFLGEQPDKPVIVILLLFCTLFNDLTRDFIANNFVIDVYSRCLQILY